MVLLQKYLEQTCDKESELLSHIDRQTHLNHLSPHMVSGHYQGRLLSLLSKLVHPRRILEVGTFTGYATLCLAEGLSSDGLIHTIEVDRELEEELKTTFSESGIAEKIVLHIGDAIEVMAQLEEAFDLVFIDADKKSNFAYYESAKKKLRKGGLIIVDNVLWKGKIIAGEYDSKTQVIAEFNAKVSQDNTVEKLILPVRDGIYLIRKL